MPTAIPRPLSVSVAACALALSTPAADNTLRIQVLPAGQFKPADGRTEGVADTGYWYVDAALASQLIARAQARATKICVDYEHQTLYKEKNGQPAPAAAWINQSTLEWVDGDGLYAVAKLTARAAKAIDSEEYLYFSPVFIFDKVTGAVLDLKLGALTNLPAIDGMQPLTAAASQLFAADLAALSQQLSTTEDTHAMDELLEQLRWLLNLPVGATADDVTAQLQKLIDQIKSTAPDPALAAASFDLSAYLVAQHTQIAALTQQVAAAATPDPAKFVPVSVMSELQGRIAALSAQINADSADALITKALADGKLLPAQEPWARDLGKSNMAALSQFLQNAPQIAALTGSQTGNKAPIAELDRESPTAIAALAQQFQAAQSALGISVSTVQAVEHVTRQKGA